MEKVVMNIYQETEYFEHHIRQLGCVTAWLSKIYDEIGCVHSAEIRAHTQGWADCLKCMDALKERKEE